LLISELAEAWPVCSGAIDTPMSFNFTFFPCGVESAKTEHEKHHYIPSIKYRGMMIAYINVQLNPLKGSGVRRRMQRKIIVNLVYIFILMSSTSYGAPVGLHNLQEDSIYTIQPWKLISDPSWVDDVGLMEKPMRYDTDRIFSGYEAEFHGADIVSGIGGADMRMRRGHGPRPAEPAPVPEPTTLLLIGAGLFCLGFMGRRYRA
jgi:hypothetical protein